MEIIIYWKSDASNLYIDIGPNSIWYTVDLVRVMVE